MRKEDFLKFLEEQLVKNPDWFSDCLASLSEAAKKFKELEERKRNQKAYMALSFWAETKDFESRSFPLVFHYAKALFPIGDLDKTMSDNEIRCLEIFRRRAKEYFSDSSSVDWALNICGVSKEWLENILERKVEEEKYED